ncbi:MAG: short-chain fatty acid transporter [Bacteroidales bacterium]
MFKKLINLSVKVVQRYLPDPFVFAILLTFIAFICAIPIAHQTPLEVMENWGNGVWSLLGFAMQMSLVLVCGSALADSVIVKKALRKMASFPKSPVQAIATVTLVASIACWINWGFGLIVGAVFAKEIAKQVKGVDYRLLIASAYSGFVVWHAGLSASIPLAMATAGSALTEVSRGCITQAIPISETVFATYNIIIVFFVIIALTVVNSLMHPKGDAVYCVNSALLFEGDENDNIKNVKESLSGSKLTPADKINNSRILVFLVAILGFGYLFYKVILGGQSLDLNSVILLFLLLGLVLHGTPIKYVHAITASTQSSAGILLQFPFYAGIMGIMTASIGDGSSLAGEVSKWCVSVANEHTFPLLSFLSAGLVNIFVPSGGGQWAVQGPIMIPAGIELGVQPAITGMAIAWGDAWTNLIQPFWAIPALAIAKLDAKDIMGFCLIDLFVVGAIICIGFLCAI